MKHNLLFFVFLLAFASCSKEELVNSINVQKTENYFFDDTELMLNIDIHKIYVDSLIDQKKHRKTKINSDLMPLTKQQAAKFYLCLDFYSKSDCKWVPCFVNKETNKIINIIDRTVDSDIYEKMSKESFYDLLRQEKVDIKLIKNEVCIRHQITKSNPDEGNYNKYFYMESTSSSVLGGVATHNVIITWFIKGANPGIVLKNPHPDVDRCDSFVSPVIGDYSQAGYSSAYSIGTACLHGNCAGTVKITTSIVGVEVGTIHYVRTDFSFKTTTSNK